MDKYKSKVSKNIGYDISCPQSCLNYVSSTYGTNWNDNSKLILVCRYLNEINSNPEKFLNYLIQQAEKETAPIRV